MSLFTPVTGIIGGALIGGSAGVLLVLNGDIMGISGIVSNSLGNPIGSYKNPKSHWRWIYLASFSLAVNTYVNFLTPAVALSDDRSSAGDVPIPSILGHILGGFVVGVGTKICNGCTTGHGICGIGRFSPRSLMAVVTFTGTSIFTRYLIAPVRPWAALTEFLRKDELPVASPLASAIVMGSLTLLAMVRPVYHGTEMEEADSKKSLGAALSGILFAAGLAVSGMTKNSKVHDFLCFSNLARGDFDPTLMAVMVAGIASSCLSYQFVQGYSKFGSNGGVPCPVALPKGSKFSIPTNTTIDNRLLVGALTFGVGWGLTGICPGPAIYAASAGVVDAIVAWIPSFLVGSYAGKKIVERVWDKKSTKKA